MIESATAPLRSKRIHIGMDEAHRLGQGQYKQLFGNARSTSIFTEHLHQVNEICRKKNLKPLIWSDMLFTLSAQNAPPDQNCYYETKAPLDLHGSLPLNINLVYWDYYHTNKEAYSKKIADHRALGFEPFVACGIWTWNRLVTALPFTFETTSACIQSCKSENIKNVFSKL